LKALEFFKSLLIDFLCQTVSIANVLLDQLLRKLEDKVEEFLDWNDIDLLSLRRQACLNFSYHLNEGIILQMLLLWILIKTLTNLKRALVADCSLLII
jgi:hypothetical protein